MYDFWRKRSMYFAKKIHIHPINFNSYFYFQMAQYANPNQFGAQMEENQYMNQDNKENISYNNFVRYDFSKKKINFFNNRRRYFTIFECHSVCLLLIRMGSQSNNNINIISRMYFVSKMILFHLIRKIIL